MNVTEPQTALPQVKACLLIGGRSSRMGCPKHLITAINGKTWIENTHSLLQPFVTETILSGKGEVPDTLTALKRIADIPDVHGPLTGILAAMRWDSDCCWLLLACDMPNISRAALRWLIDGRNPSSWGTVPRLTEGGFVEPLLALYEPQAKVYFEELCSSAIFRISMVAKRSKIKTPVVPQILVGAWSNINTPDELSRSLG